MFSVLVGWGVFWLLVWIGVFVVGRSNRDKDWEGAGLVFGSIALFYLIAVFAGRAVG